jgi:hypothetical protein
VNTDTTITAEMVSAQNVVEEYRNVLGARFGDLSPSVLTSLIDSLEEAFRTVSGAPVLEEQIGGPQHRKAASWARQAFTRHVAEIQYENRDAVDDDSASLHSRALEILGEDEVTDDAYATALTVAERERSRDREIALAMNPEDDPVTVVGDILAERADEWLRALGIFNPDESDYLRAIAACEAASGIHYRRN